MLHVHTDKCIDMNVHGKALLVWYLLFLLSLDVFFSHLREKSVCESSSRRYESVLLKWTCDGCRDACDGGRQLACGGGRQLTCGGYHVVYGGHRVVYGGLHVVFGGHHAVCVAWRMTWRELLTWAVLVLHDSTHKGVCQLMQDI